MRAAPLCGCPKTGPMVSRFQGNFLLSLAVSAMGKLLAALLKITGISWFFRGVSVEFPAYFVPNFQVVEIHNVKRGTRKQFSSGRN
jgi:hypothetical protein